MQCNLVCYNLIIRQTENKLNKNHIHTHSECLFVGQESDFIERDGGERL